MHNPRTIGLSTRSPRHRAAAMAVAVATILGTSACARFLSLEMPGQVAPPATAVATLGPAPVLELVADNFGRAPVVGKTFQVEVTNADKSQSPIELKIRVSKDRYGNSGYTVVDVPPGAKIPNGYLVTSQLLASLLATLDNDRLIVFDAKGQADDVVRSYPIRFQTSWSGPSFVAPVLYSIDGSVSAFSTAGFAPSVGLMWKRYLRRPRFEFLGAAPLLTVYQSKEKDDEARPYSLAFGAVTDLGGYVQLGGSYHFKTKRPGFIIGLRPEVWTTLFGGAGSP